MAQKRTKSAPVEPLKGTNPEPEQTRGTGEKEPDKGKYPHGEKEQPIGCWWNPDPTDQYKEHGIGNSH